MTATPPITSAPLRIRQFTTSKSGHALEECEDAIGANTTKLRFVVTDGATEAFDSGRWARQLALDWVNQSELLSGDDLWSWLGEQGALLGESWAELQLSWYAEEKARAGSFAAFVGIELNLTTAVWRGIALGDSCFFQFRDGRLLATLPDLTDYSFTSNPVLAPSLTAQQTNALKSVVTKTGELKKTDSLVLCSDALAAWLSVKSDTSAVMDLFFNADDQQLLLFLEGERSSGRLKDDDISLLAIEI
jgi:hypothetical protein